MKKFILSILSFLFTFNVHAIETEIRVVGVHLPGANTTLASNYLSSLDDFWPSSTGITINVENNGNTVLLQSVTSGSAQSQLTAAKT